MKTSVWKKGVLSMLKKVIIVFAISLLSFFSISCSAEQTNMERINQSKLEEKLASYDFSFKLPNSMPFEVNEVQINKAPHSQPRFSVEFIGPEKIVDLTVVHDRVTLTDQEDAGQIKINELNGQYSKNKFGVKTLSWLDDRVYYELSTGYPNSKEEISKTELQQIAKSMQ